MALETISDGAVDNFSDFDNRYLGQGIARNNLASLPIIDLSPFTKNGDPAERERVAQQVRQASIDIGFFYATGHGFSQAELDTLLSWGKRFFALPLTEKKKLQWNQGKGYVPPGGLNATPGSEKIVDVKERLYFAREYAMSASDHLSAYPPATHLWPDEAALPGFRDYVTNTLYRTNALTQKIGWAIARGLGLDETYFETENGRFGDTMVFNYYPPLDPATLSSTQWNFSPHTDYGSFTIVAQDKLGGLQVRNSAGQWVDVVPIPGTLIVNIGDLIALQTNDLFTSNLHRVANFSGEERISVTFFVGPPATAEIKCIETCQSPDNPALYPPVNAEEYTQMLIEQYHRTGRPGIAVQTASRFQKRS